MIDRRDIDFLIFDWLGLDELLARPHFQEHTRQTVGAVLDLGETIAADAFLPHYKQSDRDEPRFEGGVVHVLPAARQAVEQYAQAGLFGAAFETAAGGWQLPQLVHLPVLGQAMAANISTAGYVMLTVANARLIARYGTPKQVEDFARPQIEGRVLGTMCLSEPQAGSGLGDIRTRAVEDGEDQNGRRYRLFGNKMWISAGDHDITGNIIHLVLAKVPDEGGRLVEGTRGISLFIVPKRLDDREGTVRNDVAVAGLNHKMGYRGTANCLLNFGEGAHRPLGQPGAIGYLVGEVGQGLPIMFHMMNEARIDIGLGAAALACRGYALSLQYARERRQGRSEGIDGPAPIIAHADVKQMLLAQKAYAEGALALVLYCARLMDDLASNADPQSAAQSAELLGLLTPIAKTWPSEWGLKANDLAIQVHGGYGYTRDFDVEQLYRDNRLNPIHEGTTGIQGLDLLGRKILKDRERVFARLRARIGETTDAASRHPELAACGAALSDIWNTLERTILGLLDLAPATRALDNATLFLRAFGHAVVAWIWLEQALAAARSGKLAESSYHRGKQRACAYFFAHEVPKIAAWLAPVDSRSDVASSMPLDEF